MEERLLFVVNFILELEVDLAQNHWDHDLGQVFCQSLAQADSASTEERPEASRLSLSPIRSKIERTIRVPSIRQKLIWLLPLLRISVEIKETEDDWPTLRDSVLALKCDGLIDCEVR